MDADKAIRWNAAKITRRRGASVRGSKSSASTTDSSE